MVSEKVVSPHYLIKENDHITLLCAGSCDHAVDAANIPLDILYEDRDIIIVNKPAGLVVHPGAGNVSHT